MNPTGSTRRPALPADAPVEIVRDEVDWVVAIKAAGLATIPGRGESDSVLERLARQLGLPSSGSADPRLRVVHRLDKETSGVLLMAKNFATQRHFSHQFQNNTIEKQYLALVAGVPAAESGEVDAPLGPHPASPRRMAIVRHGGRPARTLWQVEQRFRGFALLRVFPKTGKTHQIRVHLRHAGMPLAIDPLYNHNPGHPGEAPRRTGIYLSDFKRAYHTKRGTEELPLIDRLTLHAEKLRFVAPGGEVIDVAAPLPKDFRSALQQLAKHGNR